ncbi:sulfatase-like hydrolase/transferase [Roseiconus lacunae]|uniref:sulfatase-like hydrolase/transferase n=1 Tax=Roseiconus lacunae TaxID=2605694 RepID=UPI00308B12D7|nr:sulfatase-like hydrolase/transferase [Stieleria sp. HD01]
MMTPHFNPAWCRVAIAIFLSVIAVESKAVVAAERPNILYLYVDDMGWGSIGPNGQWERQQADLPSVKTPHLDRLAREGVNFVRGYGCHVCSPARSSQQTGFHQGHTFADRNDPDNAKKAMRADDILIGDLLSQAGYATGYWGKWGYGGSKDQHEPTIQNVQTLPTSHGYQHVLAELHHVRAHTFFQPTLWKAPAPPGAVGGLQLVANSVGDFRDSNRFPTEPALQNHPQYPETAYCDDHYAFAALDFVRRQGRQFNQTGQPFFGLLAVQIPHAPFGEIESLPEWDRHYRSEPGFETLSDQTKQWAAMVTRIDAHFGNLLAALEDPNQDGSTDDSIADQTLVIFQSDNGGPNGKCLSELATNGGLQGVKGRIQEGGIRVPLMMRWPNEINESSTLRRGTNTETVVDVTDLFPTFCELAGIDPPLGIDGQSIAPLLTSKSTFRSRNFIVHEAGNGQSIIRDDWKLVRTNKKRFGLYNLTDDPAELIDLSSKHPAMVDELRELLIGECVTEPKGFAVTYHHWTGNSLASTSDADHWSDYEYANAGITYQVDRGSPKRSWVATLYNSDSQPNVAQVDQSIEVLALSIGGESRQTLNLEPQVNLTGRNEIRVMPNGALVIQGGTVHSLRPIDLRNGGTVEGHGTIDGTLDNSGALVVDRQSTSGMSIRGDFSQTHDGRLEVSLVGDIAPLIHVDGKATLAGKLILSEDAGKQTLFDQPVVILKARSIQGRFDHAGDVVVDSKGQRYKLSYAATEVTLERYLSSSGR